MKITRIIPARRLTLEAKWCHKEFCVIGPEYRAIRARCAKPMDSCFWCRRKFVDGEMMALACFLKIGNEVLCQECAQELLDSEKEEKDWEALEALYS